MRTITEKCSSCKIFYDSLFARGVGAIDIHGACCFDKYAFFLEQIVPEFECLGMGQTKLTKILLLLRSHKTKVTSFDCNSLLASIPHRQDSCEQNKFSAVSYQASRQTFTYNED